MTRRIGTIVCVAWLVSGCVTNNLATSGFTTLAPQAPVLLMPPDIKYYRVTASGLTEPNADWTDQARAAFDNAFRAFSAQHALAVEKTTNVELSDRAVEYDKLHSAVGATILANHFGPLKLPAKENAFDWSLGSKISDLGMSEGQRYALFVHYRDYQASGGRVGVAVFASLLGAAVYTGHQTGFASLVDLQSGDVVWFNQVPLAQGDMRQPAGAERLVSQLFATLVTAD